MNGGKSSRECNCFNSCRTVKQSTRIIELDDRIASLLSTKTKPFDVPVEGRFLKTSGEGGIRTRGGVLPPRRFSKASPQRRIAWYFQRFRDSHPAAYPTPCPRCGTRSRRRCLAGPTGANPRCDAGADRDQEIPRWSLSLTTTAPRRKGR